MLKRNPVIAIIRCHEPVDLVGVCRALFDGGLEAVEITAPTPGALEAVTELRKQLDDDQLIGHGTVIMHHEREPIYLYPELAERGWRHEPAAPAPRRDGGGAVQHVATVPHARRRASGRSEAAANDQRAAVGG